MVSLLKAEGECRRKHFERVWGKNVGSLFNKLILTEKMSWLLKHEKQRGSHG